MAPDGQAHCKTLGRKGSKGAGLREVARTQSRRATPRVTSEERDPMESQCRAPTAARPLSSERRPPMRNPQLRIRLAERLDSTRVLRRGPRGGLDFHRAEYAVALENQIDLRATVRAPVMQQRLRRRDEFEPRCGARPRAGSANEILEGARDTAPEVRMGFSGRTGAVDGTRSRGATICGRST